MVPFDGTVNVAIHLDHNSCPDVYVLCCVLYATPFIHNTFENWRVREKMTRRDFLNLFSVSTCDLCILYLLLFRCGLVELPLTGHFRVRAQRLAKIYAFLIIWLNGNLRPPQPGDRVPYLFFGFLVAFANYAGTPQWPSVARVSWLF